MQLLDKIANRPAIAGVIIAILLTSSVLLSIWTAFNTTPVGASTNVQPTVTVTTTERVSGPQGEMGAKGEKGDTGSIGPRGEQGEIGNTGPQGISGNVGNSGPRGPSGINGERGPIGETGPRGPQGIRGLQGEQGPIGERGPIGPTGPPGPTVSLTTLACPTGFIQATISVHQREPVDTDREIAVCVAN